MKILPYDTWVQCIVDEVRLLLPRGTEYDVQLQRKLTNNGTTRDSIMIRQKGALVAPAIRLQSYYDLQCQQHCSITATAQIIVNDYHEAVHDVGMLRAYQFKDDLSWGTLKHSIYVQLINTSRNMELLRIVPYESFGDMALVARIKAFEHSDGIGTVQIDNQLLSVLGVSKDELFSQAKANTPLLFPPKIENMMERLVREIYGSNLPEEARLVLAEVQDMPMYLVSNITGMNGATAVTYPGIEQQLRELLKGDFYLLPSSVHEMIAVRKDAMPVKDATDIVWAANHEAVSAEDYLSGDVYTLRDGKFINLTKEEAMQNEIMNSLDNQEELDLDEGLDLDM